MANDERDGSPADSDETLDSMFQHLEGAKALDDSETRRKRRNRRNRSRSQLQRKIRHEARPAVLASNHESRLRELVDNEYITHRSGKPWSTARAGWEKHGRLPIYYRLDGMVTHVGYISQIVIDPGENTRAADELRAHISDTDDYGEVNTDLDRTTYVVTDGRKLEEPFSQAELRKLGDGEPVAEDYSYQPAYVVAREGDFPDFG